VDEITLFAELAPAQSRGTEQMQARARARLDAALAGPGARTGAGPATVRPRRRRLVLGMAAAGAAAAAAVVTPIVAPGGGATAFATADYSVQPHPDGTFTVTIKQLRDPAGLQRALRADGIAAYVRYLPTPDGPCAYQQRGSGKADFWLMPEIVSGPTASSRTTILTIHPAKLPRGNALLIQSYLTGSDKKLQHAGAMEAIGTISLLGNDRPPVCGPLPPGKKS
jgi:hypothetical protein